MVPIADSPAGWFDGLKHGSEENHRFEAVKAEFQKATLQAIERGLQDGSVVDLDKTPSPATGLTSVLVYVAKRDKYEWLRMEWIAAPAGPECPGPGLPVLGLSAPAFCFGSD